MSNLGEATWDDWMKFLRALSEGGLGTVFLNSHHVDAMIAAFRDPPAQAEDPPHFSFSGPARPGLEYEQVGRIEDFRRRLESTGFTVDEMRRASNAESASIMLRALATARHHDMVTPPATWNDSDYVALGHGLEVLAASPSRRRAKEMAIIRGCPTPLIVPASRVERKKVVIIAPTEETSQE